MLFYERIERDDHPPSRHRQSTSEHPPAAQKPAAAETSSQSTKSYNFELSNELADWIWKDNTTFLQDKNIFCHNYFGYDCHTDVSCCHNWYIIFDRLEYTVLYLFSLNHRHLKNNLWPQLCYSEHLAFELVLFSLVEVPRLRIGWSWWPIGVIALRLFVTSTL